MKIKLSDFVVDYLVSKGITDTFLIPGGGAMHLDDSLGKNKQMHLIFNHHEQGCALAAEGYTRLSNKLALVCVTSGPGGTNAITGVMGCWVDSVPMIVISGQVKRETTVVHSDVKLRQLGDQEINITDIVKPITKFSVFVDDPYLIQYYLDKALYLATTGRMGPVWIDIPLDVQAEVIDTSKLKKFHNSEMKKEYNHYKGEYFKEIINRIKNSKRPIIYAGEGIKFSNSRKELIKFAEKYDIPIVTCWNAHDLIPDSHPLYAGRPGTVGTRGGNFNVQNSDLLIILGCRINIRQISYSWDSFAKNAFKIMVDVDKNEMKKKTFKVDIPIHTDVNEFLNYFLKKDKNSYNHKKWVIYAKEINNKYYPVLDSYSLTCKPLNPYYFLSEFTKKLNKNEIMITGNGAAAVITQQVAIIKENTRLFTNSGSATMGYAVPASIGAAVSLKGQRVICIDGDGSLQMNIQELQTIIFNKLNIKIVYLNNNGYSSMKQTQTNLFNKRFVGIGGGVGLSMPNMEKISKAYGFGYFKVDSITSMNKIKKALNTKGPVFIEVIVDENQFFAPKLSSKVLPNGKIVSPEIDDMYPFLSTSEYKKNKL